MHPPEPTSHALPMAPRYGATAAAGSCRLCPSMPVCLPRDLAAREARAFEQAIARRRRVDKDESVDTRFANSRTLHIVRFGQFKRVSRDPDGNERVTGFPMAADLMGLDAFAREGPPPRLLALEDSELCEIPFDALTRLLSTEPTILVNFIHSMSEALQQEYRHAGILASTSLDARFAAFLLALGNKFAHLGYAQDSFRLSMSRSDLASYLGTAIESVSRVIARSNAQGIVAIHGRTVELSDRPMLEAIMRGDRRVPPGAASGPTQAPRDAVAGVAAR